MPAWTRRELLLSATAALLARTAKARRRRQAPHDESPPGLLVAFGTMDLEQFWPTGTSDGDTAHVRVERFEFEGEVTHAFEGATVARKPVLHNGAVTVRWQGIDCPELHYGRSIWYRQHWGQAPSVHLAKFLRERSRGASEVDVQLTTRVRRPNDVFDKYGRFIGDVLLGDLNLNHWMLENGWAFPSLYNSLQQNEALAYLSAAAKGKSPLLGDYTDDLTLWDDSLQTPRREPPGRTYDEAEDRGWVQLPKMFRRIVNFQTDDAGGEGSLRDFLEQPGHPERVFLTRDFLRLGNLAPSYPLSQFIDDRDRLVAAPAALIFREAPSTLYGKDGRRVLDW